MCLIKYAHLLLECTCRAYFGENLDINVLSISMRKAKEAWQASVQLASSSELPGPGIWCLYLGSHPASPSWTPGWTLRRRADEPGVNNVWLSQFCFCVSPVTSVLTRLGGEALGCLSQVSSCSTCPSALPGISIWMPALVPHVPADTGLQSHGVDPSTHLLPGRSPIPS